MKRSSFATLILLAALASACKGNSKFPTYGSKFTLDSLTLMDKIKGGWAGQTIGCTYGGPTEF
ncbi:MAG: ADP-ribosylglycohydrolase family protein, partial [Bacteroidales bacterium]